MQQVEILKEGKYAKFTPDHIGRQTLEAGTMIEYPDWYAQSLIDMDLAKKPGEDEDSAQAESGQDETPEEPAETTTHVTLAEATVEESPREKAQAVQQLEEKQQEAAFRRKRR